MSLIATRVQALRIENPDFDKNMTRPQEYGALDFFLDQTYASSSIITPEMREASLNSMGKTLQMPVINYDAGVQVSNTRTCVIADNENTSALVTVVYATYQVGFTMVPSMYSNNNISYNHDWTRKIEKVTRALADALDKGAVAALEANKTQVFKDLLYYTKTGNVIDVSFDMRTEILGDLNPMMRANAYPAVLHLIGNAGIDSMIRKLGQHAEFNDVNKRLEYSDKIMHYTNNVTNEVGDFATAFAVEDGNVAILTRVDREAARGAGPVQGHEWGMVTLPFINIPVGSHYYNAVGDWSAIAGESTADLTCAVKEYYGFSIDVAFVVAYNSDPTTIANPIIKIAIDSATNPNIAARPVRIVNTEDNPIYTSEVTP
jgi:hypothetical protein